MVPLNKNIRNLRIQHGLSQVELMWSLKMCCQSFIQTSFSVNLLNAATNLDV